MTTAQKYKILAQRYRPQTFAEVVGQESIVTTLKNALRFDRAAYAYLFCGSRGVGKTSLARLFAKALNCQKKEAHCEPCNRCSSCLEIGTGQSLDVIEIDGASNRGIDDIRQINETALYSPSAGHYRIYIIDEVHMLTKEAFNALLKTLEEPPEKAKFFFATTEPHKVLPTIISRCQRFDLGRIQLSQITSKLEQIATDLGRSCEPEALHLIAAFSDGSLRDAESMFDQILCFAEGTVTTEIVRTSLGLIPQEHFFALDLAFAEAKLPFAFELAETLFVSGKDPIHFYAQLIEHVRNLLSASVVGEKGLAFPPALTTRYLQSCRLYSSSQCLYLLEYLLRLEPQIQKSSCQRVALESALLHYLQSKHRIPIETLVRRLTEMEEELKKNIQSTPDTPQKGADPPLQSLDPRIERDKLTLKTVPFNPLTLEARKEGSAAISHTPSANALQPADPIVNESHIIPGGQPHANVAGKQEPCERASDVGEHPRHHRSRYDTLMRFAATELEGILKT
ncbi:MAG TPA: DNA polymerase III subunit gamma/tau [Chlamydiales bacterium]|nr:DNA polymerase III subunit gamma/tau [Chlamydiales bacterium]